MVPAPALQATGGSAQPPWGPPGEHGAVGPAQGQLGGRELRGRPGGAPHMWLPWPPPPPSLLHGDILRNPQPARHDSGPAPEGREGLPWGFGRGLRG